MKEKLRLVMFSAGLFPKRKKEEIDIDHVNLIGTWQLQSKGIQELDGSFIRYQFGADYSCTKSFKNGFQVDVKMNWTYVVNKRHAMITLFDQHNQYQEQFKIVYLKNKEMRWENKLSKSGLAKELRLIQE